MTIRRAKESDLDSIYDIVRSREEFRASEKTPFFEKHELQGWVSDRESSIVLTAEDEGKICGFLFAKIISKHWCMLDSIAVVPECRGRGHARALMEELYRLLREKDVDYIQALVHRDQKKTREFWKNMGFGEGDEFVWIEKDI